MKTAVTVGIVLAGIVYVGDVDPPTESVAQTIHTLDEVYNVVTHPPTWEYKFVALGAAAEVIPGSGVLHGLVMQGAGGTVDLWDGPPGKGTKIGEFTNSWSSKFIELDVQFTSGIFIRGSGAATVLYKL